MLQQFDRHESAQNTNDTFGVLEVGNKSRTNEIICCKLKPKTKIVQ